MRTQELDADPAAVADLHRQGVAVGPEDEVADGQSEPAIDAAGPAKVPVVNLADDGEDDARGEERGRERRVRQVRTGSARLVQCVHEVLVKVWKRFGRGPPCHVVERHGHGLGKTIPAAAAA